MTPNSLRMQFEDFRINCSPVWCLQTAVSDYSSAGPSCGSDRGGRLEECSGLPKLMLFEGEILSRNDT